MIFDNKYMTNKTLLQVMLVHKNRSEKVKDKSRSKKRLFVSPKVAVAGRRERSERKKMLT